MKRIGIGPILMLVFVLIPLLVLAYPQPPTGNTGAPGDGNCTSCHSGVSTGGSVAITFPSGMTYSPGVTQHLSVKVTDTTHSAYSFQITARLASNTSTQAGSFTATDTVNTTVQTSGTVQDIETTSSGINQSSWNFDWTPPASNVGNVNFYVTGLAAGSPGGSATSGDGIYNASYTLTPPVVTVPALAASPSTLSVTAQQGGTAPTAQSVSVTSGGTPVSYTVATSGGTWLSASTTSGTTPGMFSVSANSSGLMAGTYNGTVTITSSGASNSPQAVPVTLTVTAPASNTVSASPSTLAFTYQTGGTTPATQNISVTASGSALSFTAAASGGSWLSVTPTSGSTPGSVGVSVNPGGLAAGTYNGTVTITASGATNGPLSVPVVLTVTAPATNTLSATPSTLSFAYQTGGTAPAAQTVSVKSSGSALSYTAAATASGGSWLSVTPTSGSTPGTVSVSVNPTGLAAGSYTGSVTITSTGAAGSPVSIPVTLVVSAGGGSSALTVAPSALRFTTQRSGEVDDDGGRSGGMAPQKLTITTSSSSSVTYTAAETTTSGGHWLSLGSTQGTTPGTLTVSVNPTGLANGTYTGNVTITPTSGQAVSVPVTLVVGTTQTSSTLQVYPTRVLFSDPAGGASSNKTVRVFSTGKALTFSATSNGGSWLTVSPNTGTTPTTLNITADPHGLAKGTYSGVVSIASGTQKTAVSVRLYVATSGDDGAESESSLMAVPVVNDPTGSGAVGATWLDAAGVPTAHSAEGAATSNSGLALAKTANAPAGSSAGAMIVPAESLTTLTELGFDIRQGTHCTASSPRFVVVTSDDVTHVTGGCANGTTQAAPAPGWTRVQFDPSNPAQMNPVITPGQPIKSISVVLDEGPEAGPSVGGGLAVIDNITVNGTVVKEQ